MKKRTLIPAGCLMFCLLLTGCGGTTDTVQDVRDDTVVQEAAESTVNDAAGDNTAELAAPIMEWWELYNPNGFDTVTAAIVNPNDVPIDVSYDLVYYKDGEEVARNEYFTSFGILPGHKDLIWANYDIKEETIDKMSANYLTAYVMTEAGLETSDYQKFLMDLYQKLPVISLMGCYDKNGNYYESATDSPYKDMVSEYKILQYNNLIDIKHTVNSFFYLDENSSK